MNRWAVRIRVTPASLQAALRLRIPAVKLSIVGTRPKACRAKKVTTPAELDGNSTPTRSPFLVIPDRRRPRAKAPRIRSV